MRIFTSHKFYADCSDKWLAKDIPDWYKNKKLEDYKQYPSQPSVKFCPSFVEIFKNSLVLKSPADMEFVYNTENGMLDWRCVDGASGFIQGADHDFTQINNDYLERYVSFKLHLDMLVISDKIETVLFLPPEYHPQTEEVSIISPMIGALETIPNIGVSGLCNFKLDRKLLEKTPYIFVPKGTPLAYYYFPNGAPKEVEYVPRHEYDAMMWVYTEYRGEYFRKLNQAKKDQSACPFHEKNS